MKKRKKKLRERQLCGLLPISQPWSRYSALYHDTAGAPGHDTAEWVRAGAHGKLCDTTSHAYDTAGPRAMWLAARARDLAARLYREIGATRPGEAPRYGAGGTRDDTLCDNTTRSTRPATRRAKAATRQVGPATRPG